MILDDLTFSARGKFCVVATPFPTTPAGLTFEPTKKVVNNYIKSNRLYRETISNNDDYMIITLSRNNDKRKNKTTQHKTKNITVL